MEDLTGKRFNHLVAIKPGPTKRYPSGQMKKTWLCLCDCQLEFDKKNQKLTPVPTSYLLNGDAKSCGCRKFINMKNEMNWTGHQFGKWTVIEKTKRPEHIKCKGAYWKCRCECGNETIMRSADIKREKSLSCGQCKHNVFDLSNDFGIGYTSKGDIFYFDKEDFDIIDKYYWSITNDGYLLSWDKERQKFIYMHRLITGLLDDKEYVVDHMNHNTRDNQKENLRVCTHRENIINSKIGKNNKTGVTGVFKIKNTSKWSARIMVNYKNINLGWYDNFEDAVKARKEAERKYFGEFAFNNTDEGGS